MSYSNKKIHSMLPVQPTKALQPFLFILFINSLTRFLYVVFYFIFQGPFAMPSPGSPFRLILELSVALLSLYHHKIE
jgi:hypothetical protein